jgi:F-box protein 18 (helicase)
VVTISDDQNDEGPLAVLCRSNSGLLNVALQCTDLRPGVKLAFVGGVETLKLDLVQDMFHLLAGHAGEVKNAYLRAFASPRGGGFKALVKVADVTGDVELGELACTLVPPRNGGFRTHRTLRRITPLTSASGMNTHAGGRCALVESLVRSGRDVLEVCGRLRNAAASVESAHVVLSTAHKAKGLEFDRVLLHDDFLQVLAALTQTLNLTLALPKAQTKSLSQPSHPFAVLHSSRGGLTGAPSLPAQVGLHRHTRRV